MKIVMIGSGNVATHLGMALKKSGHQLVQVYSRSKSTTKVLANKLSCPFVSDIQEITTQADLYIVALSDEAIKSFLQKFKIMEKTIVHTSGSVSLSVFGNKFKSYGVFYPVQTFSIHHKINFKNIPICIEANNPATKNKMTTLAQSLDAKTYFFDSKERKIIHLSAVIANNFSNHLFTISEKMLRQKNIPFDILRPLILETALKVQRESPLNMQTGPAKRGDRNVMDAHLKMLSKNKGIREIYSLLSDSISETSGIRL